MAQYFGDDVSILARDILLLYACFFASIGFAGRYPFSGQGVISLDGYIFSV
jgi:hypothetical protein